MAPNRPPLQIILTHGAGTGKDTDFMNASAQCLAGHGYRTVIDLGVGQEVVVHLPGTKYCQGRPNAPIRFDLR